MKNFFALPLIAIATIAMCTTCDAFQGPPGGRPPGGRPQNGGPPGGSGGGQRGPRGGGGGDKPMEIMSNLPIINALDADGNGEISTAEMESAATALATLDKNNDGTLDASEIMPNRSGRGRRGGRAGRGGPGGQERPRGGEGNGANGFVDRMLENDADGDGKVSSDEAPQRMQGFFDRLDEDKDGYLTKEELTAAGQRWSGGGGGGGRRNGGGGQGQRPRRPASE